MSELVGLVMPRSTLKLIRQDNCRLRDRITELENELEKATISRYAEIQILKFENDQFSLRLAEALNHIADLRKKADEKGTKCTDQSDSRDSHSDCYLDLPYGYYFSSWWG